MERGVFNTTRKLNARACSGKHRIHLGRKAHMSRSQFKTILVCFFEHTRKSCTRTNGESSVLFGSADKVTGICSMERSEFWPEKLILHHDNAPAHDALRVREFLAKKSVTKMDHPLYSP
jgi:hypothetical protein